MTTEQHMALSMQSCVKKILDFKCPLSHVTIKSNQNNLIDVTYKTILIFKI